MAMPDVYVRDSEAECERWTERDRETRQFFVRAISEELHVGLIDPDHVHEVALQSCSTR
jgi:hypothetical protein